MLHLCIFDENTKPERPKNVDRLMMQFCSANGHGGELQPQQVDLNKHQQCRFINYYYYLYHYCISGKPLFLPVSIKSSYLSHIFLYLKHSNPSILVNQRPTSGCDICGAVKHHCNMSDITS